MTEPVDALRDSIARQRADLKQILEAPLRGVAEACASAWPERAALNATLARLFPTVPHCRYLYAMNTAGIQISDNIGSRDTIGADDFGRDRSHRPYLRESLPAAGFLLSRSYITRREWRQLKGDPAIRGQVFHQTRSESLMDRHIDTVLGVVEELMTDHGMHHVMLHFSSSRAVYWTVDDPFRYHLLDIAALTDPDICLAFRKQPYPADALVPRERIRAILDALRSLRFVDETFYLRTGTLNLFNGIVGLTFSCDGSHYVPWDEFLKMDVAFWMGTA